MQVLNINLGATGSGREAQVFDIAGRYFEILESGGPVTVAFYDANCSRSRDLELANVDSGFYVAGAFQRFEVMNVYATAQTVRVAYGSGTGGSRRQPGTVRVIDQGADKTLLGAQFAGGYSHTPPATRAAWVGQQASASKRIAIKRLLVSASTAGLVSLQYATSVSGTGYTANRYTIASKLYGGADSGANLFTGTDQSTIAGARLLADVLLVANQSIEVPLTTPVILPVGCCLIVMGVQGDRTTQALFDYEEL